MNTQLRVLLDTIASHTRKEYMHQLRKLDLHVGQDQLLCHLDDKGPLSQIELAQLLNCEASTVSNMVHSLEKRQIVLKEKSSTDARTSLISVGPNGKTLIDPIHTYWEAFQDQLFNGLNETDKHAILNYLTKLNDNLLIIKGDVNNERKA